jgi:hypothetical protein
VVGRFRKQREIFLCAFGVVSDSNDNVGEHDVVEWNEYDDVDAVIDGVDKYDGDGDGDGTGRVRVGDVRLDTDLGPLLVLD